MNNYDEAVRISSWWQGAEERLRARGANDATVSLCRAMFYGGAEATLGIFANIFPEGPYTEQEVVLLEDLLEDMRDYKKEYMDPTKN